MSFDLLDTGYIHFKIFSFNTNHGLTISLKTSCSAPMADHKMKQ